MVFKHKGVGRVGSLHELRQAEAVAQGKSFEF